MRADTNARFLHRSHSGPPRPSRRVVRAIRVESAQEFEPCVLWTGVGAPHPAVFGRRSITKASIVILRAGSHTLLDLKEGRKDMYLLIRYPVGIIVEAVVLARGRNRMRVVAAGFPDTIELTRSGLQWFTAIRQPVELDFMMSNIHATQSASSSRSTAVVRAAGSAED